MRKGDTVRFRHGSDFGLESGIPDDQVGTVDRVFIMDRELAADVDFRPAGYAFGVSVEELEAAGPAES